MTNWPRLNLAVGPVEVSARTLRDLARPVIYHNDPAFKEIFARASDLLKEVYRTENDVVIFQGEAIAGLEAAAASLISPGDKVLNLVSGVFGKWFEDFIHKYGGETIELAVPYNDAVDPEEAFIASLASCHLLSFLWIAARRGFRVDSYRDEATGVLAKNQEGRLAMTEVSLSPLVTFSGTVPSQADHEAMHHEAHEECFIANSVKTMVRCEPRLSVRE